MTIKQQLQAINIVHFSDLRILFSREFYKSTQRKTFLLHLIYSIIDGAIMGVLALNEFVLLKGLQATDFQVGILFSLMMVVLLFSVVMNSLLKRAKNKQKMLRLAVTFSRIPLLLLFFFPTYHAPAEVGFYYQFAFLAIFLVYFFSNPIILPTIAQLLKTNYKEENFSIFFGYTSTVNKVVVLIFTFLFGLLLDYSPFSYTYIYPFVGIFAIIAVFILTKIDFGNPENSEEISQPLFQQIKGSFTRMFSILKVNKAYRDFEIGFMLYGFAWLVSIAVMTIFMEKVLDLNYSSIAFYKNSYNTISIVLTPFFAKLLGKIDPRKFAIYTFAAMLIHILFMALAEYFPQHTEVFGIKMYWTLIISYISYGFFAALMSLLWFIGATYFCKPDEVSDYQSIHITLTGLRGSATPLFGVAFYGIIGYSGVFLLGMGSLFMAIMVMVWSLKKTKILS